MTKKQISVSSDDIRQWLINKISSLTEKPLVEVQLFTSLSEYGLDSMHAISLSGDIEDWLGFSIEPTIAWDYPTIEAMTDYLFLQVYKHNNTRHSNRQKVA